MDVIFEVKVLVLNRCLALQVTVSYWIINPLVTPAIASPFVLPVDIL